MLFPWDEEYIATKQVMLGNAEMEHHFAVLAGYINEQYGVKPVNIIYDTFGKDNRPRLAVCLEFEEELRMFKDEMQNFDGLKQNDVSEKFRHIIKSYSTGGNTGSLVGAGYNTDDLFVYFTAFEPVARMEFNESILPEEIAALKAALNNNDIWEIVPKFTGVTFFLYTDEQVKKYVSSTETQMWADAYLALLKRLDVFGYFTNDNFTIFLDSKENFDTAYNSNWHSYFS